MAIIHSYREGEPESGDKLIVTDAAGRETKSVSVDSLAAFVNKEDPVEPGVVLTQIDNTTIEAALTAWLANNTAAEFTDTANTPYYGPITNWDTSGVTSMNGLFDADFNFSGFNEDISGWDVSNVTDMGAMFWSQGDFNQDLSGWDVSNVTSFESMFYYATAFDSDISGWDTSSANDMAGMFSYASDFNRDLSKWDVSKVTNMGYMFSGASSFSSYLNSWNVGNVTNMSWMFSSTSFDPSLSRWEVGDVTDMSYMFRNCSAFTGDGLHKWDTSEVTDMSGMFSDTALFNANIRNWDVSSVTNMYRMFREASMFNQDLSSWDVSNVTDMAAMFYEASAFSQDISAWNVPKMNERPLSFTASSSNIPAEPEWGVNKLAGQVIRAEGIEIADIQNPKDLVTKEFMEGVIDTAVNPPVVYTPLTDATIQGEVNVYDPQNLLPQFSDPANVPYYGPISEWDVSQVTYMVELFDGYWYKNGSYFNEDISKWDVSSVIDFNYMFYENEDFDQDLSKWDVSSARFLYGMFLDASDFDSDISKWDVSNVVNFSEMFDGASSFDADLSNWNVGRAQDMSFMFRGATSMSSTYFNDWNVGNVTSFSHMFANTEISIRLGSWDLSNCKSIALMFQNNYNYTGESIKRWDVSNVTNMYGAFEGCHSFNEDISGWDVSNVTEMGKMLYDTQSFLGVDLSEWDVAHISSEPTDFKTLSVFTLPAYQPRWGFDKYKTGKSGYSHTGAFADKPTTNDRVWQAGQGINYRQPDVDVGLWKVFSLNEAVHIEVDNPYWTDPAPDTITNGVFTNTNTGKGLFQGKHLPNGVSSLVDYAYSYDDQHFVYTNKVVYSDRCISFARKNGVTIDFGVPGREGVGVSASKFIFTNNTGTIQENFQVHPGSTYTFRFWAKADATTPSFNPLFSLRDLSHDENLIDGTALDGFNTSGYSETKRTFTAPVGCYEVALRFATANNTSGNLFIDQPQFNDGNTALAYVETTGVPARNNIITHGYYEYSGNTETGYEGSTGRIKLNDLRVGDQLRVRFDFNIIPQIANTTVEPALWYSNRDTNDQITYSFPLTTQPIFYGSGTVGNTFLNRPEISAWIASEEDINALALPAIKSDNPVIIQPLGLLITIIR
jgi:surface protein